MTTQTKRQRRTERRKRRLQARGHAGAAQLPPPNPGQALVCRGCAHFSFTSWNNGHVAPCRRNRWIDTRHVSPILVGTVEGAACSDFEAQPE
ncbi:MAG: hypothetical protein ABIP48_28410 [Planctomycetota bacterium]